MIQYDDDRMEITHEKKKIFLFFYMFMFLCVLFSLNVFAYSYLEARLSAPYATYTYQPGSNYFNNAVTLSASSWTSLSFFNQPLTTVLQLVHYISP